MKEPSNLLYWLWLADRCGAESKELTRLLDLVSDPFELYRMEGEELEQLPRISVSLKSRLADKTLAEMYGIMQFCQRTGVTVLTYEDPRYPARLRELEAPPAVLYVKGRVPDWNRRLCVGVVGTRSMSEYGKQSAYKLSYELAASGAVVVSGMALGVDAVSACGALVAGGCTVAVLGSGIDVVYPKNHARLMEAILEEGGAVITEYPPHSRPMSYHFPQRNRIISGLCAGLLVVEGTLKSGSMITAKTAIAQGRDVFALPGQVGEPNSEGPVSLIREGAYVARSATDILGQYAFLYKDVLSEHRSMRGALIGVEDAMRRYGVPDYYRERQETRQSRVPGQEGESSAPKKTKKKKRESVALSAAETKTPRNYQEIIGELAGRIFSEVPPVRKSDEVTPMADTERPAAKGDAREAVLETLDAETAAVYRALPEERAFAPDEAVGDGRSVHEVVTALTVLELYGLVEPLPGGQYRKRSV